MRRRRPAAHDGAGHVNVTPMIDVVMCLIVFFLLVGNLARREAGRVDLPSAAAGAEERDESPVIVGVPAPGVVTLEGRTVSAEALGEQLARVLGERAGRGVGQRGGQRVGRGTGGGAGSVEVRAARDLDYAEVRAVLAEIRDAGVPRVTLVAEQR